MKHYILVTVCLCTMIFYGCSGTDSLTSPDPISELNLSSNSISADSPTALWGYYTLEMDLVNREVNVVADRTGMFTANVVGFVNGNPAGLGFSINNVLYETDYVDVDIDVTINHPFPGFPQYDGYDVRGIFMGDGEMSLNYNTNLLYADYEVDQSMFADPIDGFGGPGRLHALV